MLSGKPITPLHAERSSSSIESSKKDGMSRGDRGDAGETTLEALERKLLGVVDVVSSFGRSLLDVSEEGSDRDPGRAVANVRLLKLVTVKGLESEDHERLIGGGESTVARECVSKVKAVAEVAKFSSSSSPSSAISSGIMSDGRSASFDS